MRKCAKLLIAAMTGWQPYQSQAQGIEVPGDPKVRPTTRLNVLWMRAFIWEQTAVLVVTPEAARAGYRIGHRALNGSTSRIMIEVLHETRVRVRRGHEARCFYAEDGLGREVALTVEKLAWLYDHEMAEIRLI